MVSISTVVKLLSSIILTPFLIFFCAIVFLAAIGKTLGVRRLYVKFLLKVFEYGRESIEKNLKRRYSDEQLANDYEDDDKKKEEEEVVEKEDDYTYMNGDCKNNGVIKNGYIPGDSTVISRQDFILVPEPGLNNNVKYVNDADNKEDTEVSECKEQVKEDFELSDVLRYIKTGMEAIIEDQVTSRFEAEELKSWNLLTRTNRNYEFINWRITVIWFIGFWIRYAFLLPLRVLICFFGVSMLCIGSMIISWLPTKGHNNKHKRALYDFMVIKLFNMFGKCMIYTRIHDGQWIPKSCGICVANHTSPIDILLLSTQNTFSMVMWLTICTAIVGYIPNGAFKKWLNEYVSLMCFKVLSSCLSSVTNYHNIQHRPKAGICVANHTSPIDVLMLACDNCYSLIGQRHGGFLGIIQRALARASPHIWFERNEVDDRKAVAERIKKHVSNPSNPPILIFPEGTCINNTSVMQFKKGSFEVGSVIYPVAIKYDPRFGDAFWNSSRYTMTQYLYLMMTSWAIVCDIWYLPPMTMGPDETAVEFANRVKRVIAEQGGLVDLVWDGQLKRMKPKKEWKERQQEEFSRRLKVQ